MIFTILQIDFKDLNIVIFLIRKEIIIGKLFFLFLLQDKSFHKIVKSTSNPISKFSLISK